jgi:hypothetical protein
MFTLGIFGEYLARIYGRTMERPPYVVQERCEHGHRRDEARANDPAARILAE